jgi:hypothetical protein
MKNECKIYSQFGEDGIIEGLIKEIYPMDFTKKNYLEIGTESGMECNTRNLREKHGWTGLLIDGSHENKVINLQKHFITKDNIIRILKNNNTPHNLNLLSIDIDGNDWYVLKEIMKHYTADIIVVEYNVSYGREDKIIKYDENHRWNGNHYYGCGIASYEILLRYYKLIGCTSQGVNAFFVHKRFNVEQENNFMTGNFGMGPLGWSAPSYPVEYSSAMKEI